MDSLSVVQESNVPDASIAQNLCKSYSLVCRAAMWRALVVVSIECGSGPESTYPNFDFMAVGPLPQMM